MEDIAEFVRKRNEALVALDMDWARDRMPGSTTDEIRLMAMHKARYECTGIADDLRHDSRKWLQERGFQRLVDDFLPGEELPRVEG